MEWFPTLRFYEGLPETVQARIRWSWQTFLAVWGIGPGLQNKGRSLKFRYLPRDVSLQEDGCDEVVVLWSDYEWREHDSPAPDPVWIRADENEALAGIGLSAFPRFHGKQNAKGIDWLAEAFEWLSGAHECSTSTYDSVGRLLFSESLHGRYEIDPKVPWAAVAFAALSWEIRQQQACWPKSPLSPFERNGFALALTHDIDFLPTSRWDVMRRLGRNLAISVWAFRDGRLSWQILNRTFQWPGLQHSLEYCLQQEGRRGIASSYNVLAPKRAHKKDCWYLLENRRTLGFLDMIAGQGMEIGLHGSYCSLDRDGQLAEEAERLRRTGHAVNGNRQHMLRYGNFGKLCEEAVEAGMIYDCSLGYADTVGYRSGACFPYRPYDFSRETAFDLIEIPLIIMDVSLYPANRTEAELDRVCNSLLDWAVRFSWGGVSVLWHDTVFSGQQSDMSIANYYWRLLDREITWLRAIEVARAMKRRYEVVTELGQ